jgi:hypothetical protein
MLFLANYIIVSEALLIMSMLRTLNLLCRKYKLLYSSVKILSITIINADAYRVVVFFLNTITQPLTEKNSIFSGKSLKKYCTPTMYSIFPLSLYLLRKIQFPHHYIEKEAILM